MAERATLPDGKRLVLAIATKQRTANLAPILHLARPRSDDRVMWMRSQSGRAPSWTDGINALLDRMHIWRLAPIDFSDNAATTFSEVSEALVRRRDLDGYYPILIFNGGAKTMPAQIDQAVFDRFGTGSVAYGDGQRACITIWHGGWREAREEPLTERIGIDDILMCNGFEREQAGRSLMPGSDPVPEVQEGYGSDPAMTAAIHGNDERKRQLQYIELPRYEDLKQAGRDRWDGAVRTLVSPIRARWRQQDQFPEPNFEQRIAAFATAMKCAAGVLHAAERDRCGVAEGSVKLGDMFEAAVARRVQAWLGQDDGSGASNAEARGVTEAWAGPVVRRIGSDAVRETDLDIVLVFRNASILNIECKAGSSGQLFADLHAKRAREDRYASIGSNMRVAWPTYSAFAGERWLAPLLARRAEFDARGFQLLDFTLPGQDRELRWTDAQGAERRLDVPPFEAQLDALIPRADARPFA
jgi:hypothetical protein